VTPAALDAAIARAVEARARLRDRPLERTVAALVAAAARWRDDGVLAARLPEEARLAPAMVAAVMPLAAGALEPDAMGVLVEREHGPGALRRGAPDGPAVVAHVLASNVPALALPAIALGCLAGAAVVVKSGRHDTASAPAFVRALAAADPDLADTVVAAYWPGGDRPREEAALRRADVVVASGGADAVAALAARSRTRLVAHGPRWSVAAVGDADPEAAAAALARDVALYEQRGCLSPHAVWVAGDARGFAARLARALDAVAAELPPIGADVAGRAARRVLLDEAEWTPGAAAWSGPGGAVVYDPEPAFRPTCALRTIRVHPLPAPAALPALLPPGAIECVGLAGVDAAPLAPALRARGVARVCALGRMQMPRLTWPCGQAAPLGALLGRSGPPLLEVEP